MFVTSFVESMAIVGVIVPGVAILFTVGALIGADALNFWHMVSWAVAGAVLGDGVSYWIGKHYQTQLTSVWPFNKHPGSLEKGVAFFERYGGKSVAMGRFFGPIRAVIPLVAGMMNMPTGRFVVANILSALAWAPAYLLPGMAFGASMELASEVALSLVVLLVTLVASLWFLGWLSHRLFLLIQPHSQDIIRAVLSLGDRYPRLSNIAGALGDPEHPEAAGLSALAGLLISASLLLILTTMIPLGIMEVLDSSIQLPLQNLTTPTGNHIMLAISVLAGNSTSLLVIFSMWGLLTAFGLRRAARHLLVGAGSCWALTLGGEYLLLSQPSLIPSLPDLYVLRASVIYGLAAVLLSSSIVFSKRWRIYSTASILVMAVTLAQLYHGSTVTAILHALMLGLIWTAANGMAYRSHSHEEGMTRRQALIIGSALIGLAGVSAISSNAPMYAPPMTDIRGSFSADDWWQSEWRRLPAARDDFAHLKNHPLNLQYGGSVDTLHAALATAGWKAVDVDAGPDWLKLLSPSTDMAELPALPHSHEGRYESYQFIKPGDDQRLTLYLWPSRYLLQPGARTIWLGEVGIQQVKHKIGLISYPFTGQEHRQALQQLADDLAESGLQMKQPAEASVLLLRDME